MEIGNFIQGYVKLKEAVKGYGDKSYFLWRIDDISKDVIFGKSIVLKNSRNVIKEQVSESWEFNLTVKVSDVERMISKGEASIVSI